MKTQQLQKKINNNNIKKPLKRDGTAIHYTLFSL